MSKSIKNQPASRPPVDALQYEKLALSAFGSCERQLTQLNRLATLATSIYRNPALTHQERRSRQVLLELLVETCEEYEREVEGDRELYQVIALDAKGVAHRRITASAAAKLLAEAGKKTMQARADAEPSEVTTHEPTYAKTDAVIHVCSNDFSVASSWFAANAGAAVKQSKRAPSAGRKMDFMSLASKIFIGMIGFNFPVRLVGSAQMFCHAALSDVWRCH